MSAIVLIPSFVSKLSELSASSRNRGSQSKPRCARSLAQVAYVLLLCIAVLATICFSSPALGQSATRAELTSPAAGSVLPGTSATFKWTPGTGVTVYRFYLGTTHNGSNDLYDSGNMTATSLTLNDLPANGVLVYVALFSYIDAKWEPFSQTNFETGLSAVSCASSSLTGSGTDNCTVTLTAPTRGVTVDLASGNAAVSVPATVKVPANATSAAFTATVSAVSATQAATLTASKGSVSTTFGLQLNAATSTLGLSASSLAFGNVVVNQTVSQTVTLSSTGNLPVTVSSASVSGAGFTISGGSFPVTLNPGQSAAVTVQFDPTSAGGAAGSLIFASNSSTGSATATSLSGTGTVVASGLSCASSSFTGSGSDACTVTLNAAAPSGGASVTLVSSNSAVTVPASFTVAAGASSASFTAAVASVSTTQTATLTASAGSASATVALQLNAASPTLSLSAGSVTFGNQPVNTAISQQLTLSSTGNVPVTMNSATLMGVGFTISGVAFPVTLNPAQTATFTVQFDPTSAGSVTGQLSISSNSITGSPTVILLSGAGTTALSGLSCDTASFTGSGSSVCTATLNAAAATGGASVSLASSNSMVTVPASVMVPAGSASASFTATVSSVTSAQTATLSATSGGASASFAMQLNAAIPTLSVSAGSLAFGNQLVNTAASQSVTLNSTGNVPVTVNSATMSGAGFTVSGASFPVTLNPGQSATIAVQFDPTSAGTATGTLTFASNSSTGASTVVSLSGTGNVTLTTLTCATASFTGSGSDACTATLNVAAPSGGVSVSLTSNNSSVTVPASVTVIAGASSASFTATVASVNTAQTASLTASEGGASSAVALQLNAATPTLALSEASVNFGNVPVNTAVSQAVTLNSSGNVPVTISSAAVSGAGFTVSGASFPVTLNPGQSATVTVQFDPTVSGAAAGTLTLASNSSTGASTVVSLSGNSTVTLTALTCANAAFTASGSDACTVTLNAGAPSGGVSVSLTSSNGAVTVPGSVTVGSGATGATFTATVAAVTTTQTVSLTATEGSSSMAFAVQLNPAAPTMSVSAASVAFGNVVLNTPATQSLTLTSTGGGALTINSAALTGTGFSLGGATFPITLNAGQTTTLELEFDPTVAGSTTGTLTIASNSSTGATTAISLSGAGEEVAYQVNLSWTAPSSPSDPIAGYDVFRAPSGSTMYQLLNSSVDSATTFVDTTVQDAITYDYYVESVDGSGVTSAPSSTIAMVIP